MKKPERPQNMNGDAGHIWHMIEYTNDRIEILEKRITQLFFTIILGLSGVVVALIALIKF